jgi:patatin-like phospholipase/acyl hydrolase
MTRIWTIYRDHATSFILSVVRPLEGMLFTAHSRYLVDTDDSLIAIMLGRLRMTTEEALQQYRLLASRIFSKENRKNWLNSEYKASTLEECIKTLVEEKSSKGNTMLGDGQGRVTGNTFVCATPARNFSHPRLFRSYEVRENATDDCYIWEAARATTAAPRFFKSIAIGKEGAKEEFIDAALGWNNPTKQVCLEARSVYGDHASRFSILRNGVMMRIDHKYHRPWMSCQHWYGSEEGDWHRPC